jgi:pyruvate dehydrogenase E1 component alpha subunit
LIAFERRIADLWEAGELPYLIHLSGGNEDALIEIFQYVHPGDWVFSTHRSHYHALLSGMDPFRLEQMILSGDSMFVFERRQAPEDPGDYLRCQVNFVTSSILAATCGIAAGVAWSIKAETPAADLSRPLDDPIRPPHVWCFLGDGAEEEGHFYEAAMLVCGHDLPCTFIIEDNNRSVETATETRRGPHWQAPEFSGKHVRRYQYAAAYPHAGSGCNHQIVFKDKPARVG